MCSISGFISSEPLDRERARRLGRALLYYGSSRGRQSAGAYVNGRLAKQAISPSDFIDTSDFFNLFVEEPTHALFHTRMPTCGGLGDAQAQPFVVGKTASVHNGMYYNTSELKEKWNIRKKSGVDSELLTSFVNSYGVKMLPDYIKSSAGVTAAAIWYANEMYLMRDSNPVSIVTLKLTGGPKISVFASTEEMLMSAIKYVWLVPDSFKSTEISDGILYKLTPDGPEKLTETPVTSKASWYDYDGFGGSYSFPYKGASSSVVTHHVPKNLGDYDRDLIDSVMGDLNKERKLTRRERKIFRKTLRQALSRQTLTPTHSAYGSGYKDGEVGGE